MASFGTRPAARRCWTSVIASAFSRCASRGLFARVSTLRVTKARSGARRSTASPVVTINGTSSDGGEGGGCANAGTADHRDADATIRTTDLIRLSGTYHGGPFEFGIQNREFVRAFQIPNS